MTDDRITDIFQQYGQFVTGRERALIRAVAEAVAPQRTWVGLTDEEVFDVWLNEMPAPDKVFYQKLCRSVEAKLKEKNT